MFDLNLQKALKENRDQLITSEELKAVVQHIFDEKETLKTYLKSDLSKKNNFNVNDLCFDELELNKIVHINNIQKLCVKYRLRFLDTHLFKGEYPSELFSIIPKLEAKHNTKLENFRIMAPSKLFRLRSHEDPLLFVPIGNGYYYLVHKWGSDLKTFRRFLVWPFKNVNTLIFTSILLSLISTAIGSVFFNNLSETELFIIFIFNIKSFVFITFYVFFMMNKNFNETIWDSAYRN